MIDTPAGPSKWAWHKSSYSNPSGANCVEVARLRSLIAMRDSKDSTGPVLIFDVIQWEQFLLKIKTNSD